MVRKEVNFKEKLYFIIIFMVVCMYVYHGTFRLLSPPPSQ